MKVADLLQFLKSLEAPLKASGSKRAASDLLDACERLAPFGDLTIAEFAEFLRKADHYARTGEIPVKAARSSKAAAEPDPAKVKAAAQSVTSLYERAIDSDVNYAAIERELKQLEKKLSKAEVIAVAREVNISKALKTKKGAMEAIKTRIFDRKQSFQRTEF